MIHCSLDLASIIQSKNYEEIPQYLLSIAPLIVSAVLIVIAGFIISNFIGKLVVKGLQAKGVDPSIHSFIKIFLKEAKNKINRCSRIKRLQRFFDKKMNNE